MIPDQQTPSSPKKNSANGKDAFSSAPAFLDLADSAARMGSNLPGIDRFSQMLESKRAEHERQRAAQRLLFEEQMRFLEHLQKKEEQAILEGEASENSFSGAATAYADAGLLSNPAFGLNHHVALSAPTTPPLGHAVFTGNGNSGLSGVVMRPNGGYTGTSGSISSTSPGATNVNGMLTMSNGTSTPTTNGANPFELINPMSTTNKRKSVNITPSPEVINSNYGTHQFGTNHTFSPLGQGQGHAYGHGARSMPASRRGSAGSREGDELAASLAGLGISSTEGNSAQGDGRVSSIITSGLGAPTLNGGLNSTINFASGVNNPSSAFLFQEELDNEMQNSLRYLPTAAEDDRFVLRPDHPYARKLSVSSAALDLAPLSQTPPRSSYLSSRNGMSGSDLKSSEWPQFSGPPRPSSSEMRSSRLAQNGVLGSGAVTAGNGTPIMGGTPVLGTHPLSAVAMVGTNSSTPGNHDGSSLGANGLAASVKHMSLSTSNTPQLSSGLHHSPERRDGSPSGSYNETPRSAVGIKSVPTTPLSTLPGAPGVAINTAMGALTTQGSSVAHISPSVEMGGPGTPTYGGMSAGTYDNITFGSISGTEDPLQAYVTDPSGYGLPAANFGAYRGSVQTNGLAVGNTSPNVFEGNGSRGTPQAGSTALYQHHGSRYGLTGMNHGGNRIVSGAGSVNDSKMGALHGPKHKRGDVDREFNRFAGSRLEDLQGEILALCKDQHGCRFLQKKLEEGIPEHRDMIFRETFGHFAELMVDPFGNYLCQKLLEYSTEEQGNIICESVANDLVSISLNMHGTRAVQKMIDFLSTQRQERTDQTCNIQIHAIIVALSMHVVTLIKDLNGNHVVQKCLNKLAPEDNQFIYNAVAQHCVEVATHRHGCCVLQRCIDHASDSQRVQLVTEITYHALTLVQDPYGNYVVQYILDLNDNRFSDAVIRQFLGNVCALSVQKFSSNVIEKCIRVAEHNTRKMLIEELLNRSRLEKLLRDSFGNYCVQTALDYAEPTQRMMLVEGIRPILPLIRNTPYGKRIQSKLQREQMEAASVNHYGAGFQNHSSVMGVAGLSNNGGPHARHMAQPTIHHNSQIAVNDAYSSRASLYSHNLAPSAGLHSQPHHLPGLGLPQHSLDSGYASHHILPTAGGPSILGGAGVGGLSSYSTPLSGQFNGNVGLTAGMPDPYRNSGYSYGF